MSAHNFKNLPETIEKTADITKEQLAFLLATEDDAMIQDLKQRARNTGDRIYGKNVYIRGLIEFTNYCKNDCLYCGIRRSNCHADRYRLTEEEILSCCKNGYELGFCTFVLQGGEDGFYTDEKICQIVSKIKAEYPDCAVTLSIGENQERAIRHILMRGQTGICCATRRQMRHIIRNCTRQRCPIRTGCAVLEI